jgi:hypothetical protein
MVRQNIIIEGHGGALSVCWEAEREDKRTEDEEGVRDKMQPLATCPPVTYFFPSGPTSQSFYHFLILPSNYESHQWIKTMD